jgi:putative transposase
MTTHRKKLKRHNEPGHARFLTFSCYRRLPLLSKDRTRLWFLDALTAARVKSRFELWAWVIMPDHVHLLIHPSGTAGRVSDLLNSIKKSTADRALRYLRKQRSSFLDRLAVRGTHRFWQAGGGWDQNVVAARRIVAIIE